MRFAGPRPLRLPATFSRVLGSWGMKTFLKILLIVAVAALVVHLWPVAAVPIVAGLVVALAVGGVFAGVVALVLGVLVCIALAVLGVAVGLLAALSPIWIPLLLIVGIVGLVKASSRQHA